MHKGTSRSRFAVSKEKEGNKYASEFLRLKPNHRQPRFWNRGLRSFF